MKKHISRQADDKTRGMHMAKTNDDLAREIGELKTELKQMKEIVNMLFTIIVESEDEEDEEYAPSLGLSTPENFRINN
jgi:hypothetical protein